MNWESECYYLVVVDWSLVILHLFAGPKLQTHVTFVSCLISVPNILPHQRNCHSFPEHIHSNNFLSYICKKQTLTNISWARKNFEPIMNVTSHRHGLWVTIQLSADLIFIVQLCAAFRRDIARTPHKPDLLLREAERHQCPGKIA